MELKEKIFFYINLKVKMRREGYKRGEREWEEGERREKQERGKKRRKKENVLFALLSPGDKLWLNFWNKRR